MMNVLKKDSPYKMVSIQNPDGSSIEFAARKIRGEASLCDFTVPARYQVLYYTKGKIENAESGSYISIASEDIPYKEEKCFGICSWQSKRDRLSVKRARREG